MHAPPRLGRVPYGFQTEADVVARSFDFGKLKPIEIAYEAASSALSRLKGRVEDFTARYGWDLPSGVRVLCPLQLEMRVAVLPEGEPVEPAAGPGGAPPTPLGVIDRRWWGSRGSANLACVMVRSGVPA